MQKSTVITLSLGAAVIMASIIGFELQKDRVVKETVPVANEAQKIVDFQKEVIPIVESAIKQEYANKPNLFPKQADYYYDNADVNSPKVVFITYQENAKEIRSVLKVLKERLGSKLVVRKGKVNPEILRNLYPKVADYVNSISDKNSSYSIGIDVPSERIMVRGQLSDKQAADIKQKYGEYVNVIVDDRNNIPVNR
ncbi:hypothetical protein EJP77_10345 [Paenibacillus zeisoli]|uniref:Uncharacterized protein n=1 Tax=Paenibacillus zeisoli TaxID=2496267 RepID=A0A3S1JP02_9BACL|nr:hypothetical protein [Paenibacillus zeisoli]RUT31777.1 hypothetical protein EJP77_10345 [Paenibacillus zeisoli]